MSADVNLYEILDQIKIRKAMYLGNDYTLLSLDNFIRGFTIASRPNQLIKENSPSFGFFSTWLLGHINKNFGSSGGWYWQIHNRNTGKVEDAFNDFFDLLEKFKDSKFLIKKILVDDKARLYNRKTSPIKRYYGGVENENRLNVPNEIIWSSLTNSKTIWIDQLDEHGNNISSSWYLTSKEAKKVLADEFGEFENKWKKL
jgi:hypothetical protein